MSASFTKNQQLCKSYFYLNIQLWFCENAESALQLLLNSVFL